MTDPARSTVADGLPGRLPKGEADTIIYVGAFEFPDRNAAAQRAVANASIFRALGYRVVLVGLSRDIGNRTGPRRAPFDMGPFDCWELPYPAKSRDWLRRVVSGADVLKIVDTHYAGRLAAFVLYDYPAVAQERLRRAANARGAVAIAEATEWYSVSRLRSVAALVRNIDRPLRMRWGNLRMDAMIVASEFLRDFYARGGRPVLELPTLLAEPSPSETQEGTPDGRPKRLFFAGSGFDSKTVSESREGPKDRLDKVMEALDVALPLGGEFVLDVYGVERADYLAVMPLHADMLRLLGNRVLFHGRQPRELVRAALARADYSIFLRKKSIVSLAGFPTKFGESIHFGTPVITNALGSLMRYHTEGRTGWYIDYDDSVVAGTRLASILLGNQAEVSEMKYFCRNSNAFQYAAFVNQSERFMAALNKREQ